MPINRETGKDRWRRVPKDYFKGRDRLQTTKLFFSTLAFILSLSWLASGIDWKNPAGWKSTDGNSLRANHGPLARVHAAWDNQCEACHVPFEPIDGRGLFASASSPSNRSSDQLCMTCHAGPSHHASVIESEVKACAECHRDHQGRDASLVRLLDNDCTRCHQALDTHIDKDKKKAVGNRDFALAVTGFNVNDHPPFAPEAVDKVGSKLQDRGRLKFNHARHMMPGIVKKLGDTPYTIDKIPLISQRARYQKTDNPTDSIQLDCASCHQLDASETSTKPTGSVAQSRSPGRYYRPITFENDCRACHTLTFDPGMKNVEVPHGVQPDLVIDFLKRTYAAQILSDQPKLLEVYVPATRLPGKSPIPSRAQKALDDAVTKASAFLFPVDDPGQTDQNRNNCLECHYYGKESLKGIPSSVEPTNVPEIWFRHASFDHTAHRAVSCRDCHAGSYGMSADGKTTNPKGSISARDYLIPSIDNCAECHAPTQERGWFGTAPTSLSGGASFDCTECHRYHNGDRTFQGARCPGERCQGQAKYPGVPSRGQ